MINKVKNSMRLKQFKNNFSEFVNLMFDFFNAISLIFVKNDRKITVITASDEHFYNTLIQLINNLNKLDQVDEIIIYDLGLSKNQKFEINKNYQYVNFKIFDFSKYPKFVGLRDKHNKLGSYAWKSSIIYDEIKNTNNLILWMDSANLFSKKKSLINRIIIKKGFYSPYSNGSIKQWTHQETLNELSATKDIENKRNLTGGLIGVNTNDEKVVKLIQRWKEACLDENIISPIGSSRDNHRQDQSILSILFHQEPKKKYYFKTKKIAGIKVNQNPNQVFYILDNEKFVEFKRKWMQNYYEITTNTIFNAKFILIFSINDLQKIPKKVLNDIVHIFIYINKANTNVIVENYKGIKCTYIVNKEVNPKIFNSNNKNSFILLTHDLNLSHEFLNKELVSYL